MVSYRCGDVASELFVDRLDFLGTKKIIASPLIFPRVLLKPREYFFGIRTPTRNCCSIEYYFLVCTQKVVKHFDYIDPKKTFTYNLKFVFKDEALCLGTGFGLRKLNARQSEIFKNLKGKMSQMSFQKCQAIPRIDLLF